MHIALLAAEYPPVWGGIGAFNYYLAGALVRIGHKVLVVTRETAQNPPHISGVEVVRFKDTRVRFLSPRLFGKRAAHYLASRKDIDVVHLSYTLLGLSEKDLFSMGQPTVATMHGSWHGERAALRHCGFRELTFNDATVKIFGGLLKQYEATALKCCDCITTVSQFTAREFRQHYRFPNKSIEIIPNGVDTDLFYLKAEARTQVMEEFNLKSETSLILCVGRLVSRKGIPDLLEAFKICSQNSTRSLTLLLVGEGKLKGRIQNLTASLKLGNNVKIKSGLSVEKLATYMAAADVFVLPSRYEAFGMVYLEAMACGTPAVGTRVGGIPEVISDGKDGLLCESSNPVDLAEKILALISHSGEIRRMGDNGCEKVFKNFTWKIVAEKYLKAYDKAIAFKAKRI